MPEKEQADSSQPGRKGVIIHACLLGAVAIFVYVGFYFLVGSR